MRRRRVSDSAKKRIADRAEGCCEYCAAQSEFSQDSFSVEHIQPSSRGGSNDSENLPLSCQGCNNFKFTATTGVDPVTGKRVPLFHPRRGRWLEHFGWSEDFTEMVGVTPVGRATIVRLQLNRRGLVNQRRVLHAMGEHPPPRFQGADSEPQFS